VLIGWVPHGYLYTISGREKIVLTLVARCGGGTYKHIGIIIIIIIIIGVGHAEVAPGTRRGFEDNDTIYCRPTRDPALLRPTISPDVPTLVVRSLRHPLHSRLTRRRPDRSSYAYRVGAQTRVRDDQSPIRII